MKVWRGITPRFRPFFPEMRLKIGISASGGDLGAAAMRVLAGFRRSRGKVTGVRWEQADPVAAMADQPGNLAELRDPRLWRYQVTRYLGCQR